MMMIMKTIEIKGLKRGKENKLANKMSRHDCKHARP